MKFPRQEYWSGLSFPPPVDLLDPRVEPVFLESPALADGFFTTGATWEFSLITHIQSRSNSYWLDFQIYPKSVSFSPAPLPSSWPMVRVLPVLCSGFLIDFTVFTFMLAQCSGEGNGTPLQYSCLENCMDGGAWWAAVHGVEKSQTRLSDFTFTFHFHALVKEMATHSSVLAWRIPGTGEPGGLPSMGSH